MSRLAPRRAPSGAKTELHECANEVGERAAARLVPGVAQRDARQRRLRLHRERLGRLRLALVQRRGERDDLERGARRLRAVEGQAGDAEDVPGARLDDGDRALAVAEGRDGGGLERRADRRPDRAAALDLHLRDDPLAEPQLGARTTAQAGVEGVVEARGEPGGGRGPRQPAAVSVEHVRARRLAQDAAVDALVGAQARQPQVGRPGDARDVVLALDGEADRPLERAERARAHRHRDRHDAVLRVAGLADHDLPRGRGAGRLAVALAEQPRRQLLLRLRRRELVRGVQVALRPGVGEALRGRARRIVRGVARADERERARGDREQRDDGEDRADRDAPAPPALHGLEPADPAGRGEHRASATGHPSEIADGARADGCRVAGCHAQTHAAEPPRTLGAHRLGGRPRVQQLRPAARQGRDARGDRRRARARHHVPRHRGHLRRRGRVRAAHRRAARGSPRRRRPRHQVRHGHGRER